MTGADPDFQARDPDFQAGIAASFAKQGLMARLGIVIDRCVPGRVVLSCPFSDRVSQQLGYFHGGAIGACADSAGGYAALSLLAPGREVVTVEYKINFMAPARGRRLIADGRVLKPGRTLTVCTVAVSVETDDGRLPCAITQQTVMAIDPPR